MDAPLKTRNRFAEFVLRRKEAQTQNKWVGMGSQPDPSAAPSAVWNPPWIRALDEFAELEQIINDKIENLNEKQRQFLRPKFLSDEEEVQMQRGIDSQTADTQRLLKELDRMVINGMAPRDPTNGEEVRIAANARKLLSTRLKVVLQAFKSGQEYYGNQLKQRERKLQKYSKFGSDESHHRVEQESKATGFMEMGYTEADIQELLLEEARNEQVSKEIKDILDGVQEIHAMFDELHMLVADQGTMLDRIDFNVQKAEISTEKGLQELKKAQEHQESTCVLM